MKRRKSILGLVLSCGYLLCAGVMIYVTGCQRADMFCGRIIGALVAALPWTIVFFDSEGEMYVMVIVSGAGIAVNAVIIYLCGWAVEGAFRSWRASQSSIQR
jgi:hypothetical protein